MGAVKIDYESIPKLELRIFCESIADLAKRLMEDPKRRAEFEEWQRTGLPEWNKKMEQKRKEREGGHPK